MRGSAVKVGVDLQATWATLFAFKVVLCAPTPGSHAGVLFVRALAHTDRGGALTREEE